MPFPTMTATQQFTITPNVTDRKGHPADVQDPVYQSSNEAVATVVASPDGKSAAVIAQGPGNYTISFLADGDLGEGVKTISGSDSGTVTLGEAVNVGLPAGPVTEQE